MYNKIHQNLMQHSKIESSDGGLPEASIYLGNMTVEIDFQKEKSVTDYHRCIKID